MKYIIKRELKRVEDEAAEALKELEAFRDDCVNRVQLNPFIQKKKDIFWRLWEWMNNTTVPTPYEDHMNNIQTRYTDMKFQILRNKLLKIEVIKRAEKGLVEVE